jgi:hypothetical protein
MSDPPSSGDEPDKTGRKPDGTFAHGNHANPNGRPQGSRNKTTLICEQLLDKSGRKLTKIAIEKAEAGDMIALRMALDRIIPVRRERPKPFAYERPKSAAEVPQAIDAVLQQMADGTLTASEGASIISGIEALRASFVSADLEARVKALEEGRTASEPAGPDSQA